MANLPQGLEAKAGPAATRLLTRGARIDRLSQRFAWGPAEHVVVELLIRAVEAGDFAGSYVPAQRLVEKVDGTRKSGDMIGGHLDNERDLARWYVAKRADWTRRDVPWWGMVLVLVNGWDIERAEAAAGRRRRRYLAEAINAEVANLVLEMRLDKGARKSA